MALAIPDLLNAHAGQLVQRSMSSNTVMAERFEIQNISTSRDSKTL